MRIAIIGCGKQAPKHINGLRKCPGVEIVLADSNPEAARGLGEQMNIPWVESPDHVFSDPDIVAVDVCAPTSAHAELITRSLEAGKDFFCEKPLCETQEEARAIRAKTQETGRIGQMGYIYRFAPIFERGRDIMGDAAVTGVSPVLGRLTCATMRIGGRGSHMLWKHMKASGGGAISEMLVHMLDLAVWYFGRIEKVDVLACDLLRPRREIQGEMHDVDAEDFVIVRLATASGVPVIIQADLVTPSFTQLVEIQGDNGSFMGSIQADLPGFVFTLKEAGDYKVGRTDLYTGQVNMFEAQMARFVESVKMRRQPLRGTVDDAVHVMEVLEMMRKALAAPSS